MVFNIFSYFSDLVFEVLTCVVCQWLVIATDNVNLFSYNSLRSATRNFHPSNRIGGGGFGVVYKVSLHRFRVAFVVTAAILQWKARFDGGLVIKTLFFSFLLVMLVMIILF